MILQSEGIVLRTLKYGDTSLIASLYLEQAGMQDFIIKGVRKATKRPRHGHFQLLSILHCVYYDKPDGQLKTLSESQLQVYYQNLQENPIKLVYALLLTELYYQALRQDETNIPLYRFIRASLIQLDGLDAYVFEFVLHHLLHLTRYLGFFPHMELEDDHQPAFDLEGGRFYASSGEPDPVAETLCRYINIPAQTEQLPPIPKSLRKPVLDRLLRYYQLHLSGFMPPKSLAVFEQVFAD